MTDYLVVGLGNPGREYEATKHNIAWMAFEQLGFYSGLVWKDKFKGEFSLYNGPCGKVIFLRPQTFMNLSGESIGPAAKFFKIPPAQILIVHDELDLPLGQMAFKKGGGLAGHNGLKSTAKILGTQDFLRLRIGIGRPDRGAVDSWVLSPFRGDDLITLEEVLGESAKALESFLKEGLPKTMNKFNKKKLS